MAFALHAALYSACMTFGDCIVRKSRGQLLPLALLSRIACRVYRTVRDASDAVH